MADPQPASPPAPSPPAPSPPAPVACCAVQVHCASPPAPSPPAPLAADPEDDAQALPRDATIILPASVARWMAIGNRGHTRLVPKLMLITRISGRFMSSPNAQIVSEVCPRPFLSSTLTA